MQRLILLTILVLCISSAFAAKSRAESKGSKNQKNSKEKDKYATGTKPCNPRVFSTLDTTCAMPKIMPLKTIEECFPKKNSSKESVQKQAFAAKRGESGKASETDTGSDAKQIKPGRRPYGPAGGPMCFVKCVFEKEGMCDKDGIINFEATKAKFLAGSNDTWKATVEKSVDSCWAEFQKIDYSEGSVVPADAKACRGDAAMLTACFRRSIFMDCKAKIDVEKWEEKKNKIEKCDPFSIPPPKERSAKRSDRKQKKADEGKKDKRSKNVAQG